MSTAQHTDTEAQATRTARESIPDRVGVSASDLAALAWMQRKVERALYSERTMRERELSSDAPDYARAESHGRAATMLDITRANLLHTRRMLSGLDIARTL